MWCGVLLLGIACILLGDCSASSNTHEEEIDRRLQEAILMEGPDILVDLREVNLNGNDK